MGMSREIGRGRERKLGRMVGICGSGSNIRDGERLEGLRWVGGKCVNGLMHVTGKQFSGSKSKRM